MRQKSTQKTQNNKKQNTAQSSQSTHQMKYRREKEMENCRYELPCYTLRALISKLRRFLAFWQRINVYGEKSQFDKNQSMGYWDGWRGGKQGEFSHENASTAEYARKNTSFPYRWLSHVLAPQTKWLPCVIPALCFEGLFFLCLPAVLHRYNNIL